MDLMTISPSSTFHASRVSSSISDHENMRVNLIYFLVYPRNLNMASFSITRVDSYDLLVVENFS